jgi:hypothetical protein
MTNYNKKIILIILIIIIIITIICGIYNYTNIFKNKEGFYGYHPHHPSWPWYWYNFPSRMYVPTRTLIPTRNMVVDMRGDPRCPNFGECGEAVRSGNVIIHPERHPANYLWGIPTTVPHFFYYDYWFPTPRFDYSVKYNADGSMYKIKEEKVETVPSASN